MNLYLIDEICSLWRPFVWKFVEFYLHLLCEDVLSDLLPVSAIIRSSAEHKFVAHHSECEIVGRESMVLMADHLRRHIARSSTGVLMIIVSHYPRHSQIGYPQISFRIKHKILRFQISVNDFVLMQII